LARPMYIYFPLIYAPGHCGGLVFRFLITSKTRSMGRMEEPYRCFAFQIYQELERLHKYLYKMFQKSEVMFLGPQTEKNRELVTC
jgi:hypothetical protein